MPSNDIHRMLHGNRKRKRSRSPPTTTADRELPPNKESREEMPTASNGEHKAGANMSFSKERRRRKQIEYYRKCYQEDPPSTKYNSIPPSSGKDVSRITLTSARIMQLAWTLKLADSIQNNQLLESPIYQSMSRYYKQLKIAGHNDKVRVEEDKFRMEQLEIQNRELAKDYQKEKKQRHAIQKECTDLKKKYSNLKAKHAVAHKKVMRNQIGMSSDTSSAASDSSKTPSPQLPSRKPKAKETQKSKEQLEPSDYKKETPKVSIHQESENLLEDTEQLIHQSPLVARPPARDEFLESMPITHNESEKQSIQQQSSPPRSPHIGTAKQMPPPKTAHERVEQKQPFPNKLSKIFYHTGSQSSEQSSIVDSPSVYHDTQGAMQDGLINAKDPSQRPKMITLKKDFFPPQEEQILPLGNNHVDHIQEVADQGYQQSPIHDFASRRPQLSAGQAILRHPYRQGQTNPSTSPMHEAPANSPNTNEHDNYSDKDPSPSEDEIVDDSQTIVFPTETKPDESNSRRVTISPNPNALKLRDANASHANRKGNSHQYTSPLHQRKKLKATAPGHGWISAKTNHDFMDELDDGKRVGPNSKDWKGSTSKTQPPEPSEEKVRDPSEFRYVEVVRKKSEREKLRPHTCADCGKFIDAVMEGNGANVFSRHELECTSRHRSRYTQQETNESFWDMDFKDEREKGKRWAEQES